VVQQSQEISNIFLPSYFRSLSVILGVNVGKTCQVIQSSFIPDIRPGRFQLIGALLVMCSALIVAVASIPYGRMPLRVDPAVVPAIDGVICFANLCTAILLIGQARPTQTGLAAKLAAAYLFSCLAIIPNVLSFPGVFTDGIIIGGFGTSTWLWVARHVGFALFVAFFAATARVDRLPAKGALTVFGVAIGAVTLIVLGATYGLPYLPVVIAGNNYHRLNTLGIGPFVAACNIVAFLLVVIKLRASNTVDLWLAVAMGVACLDVALRLTGNARFTLGWYSGQMLGLLSNMIVFGAMLFESLRTSALKSELNYTLQRLSLTDALTELPNRRAFDISFQTEWRRAEREALPISVMLIDIDQFKMYNDRLGHPAGDRCLRLVSRALFRVARRPLDLASRMGGEEFALLLPNTEAPGAAKIAEMARAAVHGLRIPHPLARGSVVTVSVGVATVYPAAATSAPETLIDRADQALYQAKQAGRNRVSIANEPTLPPELDMAVADPLPPAG
jgi:diguanylate cyclase (GGDEF)-like protein